MALFNSCPGVRVRGVYDPDAALRERFSRDHDVPACGSMNELLALEDIQIAAIFMPHNQCRAAAEACAKRGLHLMIEKPMAATVADGAAIVHAAEQAGVKLTTGYCWRYHPAAVEIRRLVESGVIGRVIAAEGRCAAGRLQRYIDGGSAWMLESGMSGGGPLFNLGVHWIDLFRHILKDEVTSVSAVNVKVNETYDIEDNSLAHLKFCNGAILALDISYTVPDAFPYGRDLYVALRGTRGVISWSPAYEGEVDRLHICSDADAYAGAANRTMEFNLNAVPGYSGYMGLAYVRNFIRSVITGGSVDITGEDGVAALRVVEACYRSSGQGCWVGVEGEGNQ